MRCAAMRLTDASSPPSPRATSLLLPPSRRGRALCLEEPMNHEPLIRPRPDRSLFEDLEAEPAPRPERPKRKTRRKKHPFGKRRVVPVGELR